MADNQRPMPKSYLEALEVADSLLVEVARLEAALRGIDSHPKRLLIDQGRGLSEYIKEALRD